MKRLIIIIGIFSCFLWPINYFWENQGKLEKPKNIFHFDHQAQQQVLRNINLYPTPIFARLFQNKGTIITNKFLDSFFSLYDPNYYFFGSHPREVINGQNHNRLPMLCFIPIIWFIFKTKSKHKKKIFASFVFLTFFMSFFVNYFILDLLLLPILLVLVTMGLLDLYNKYNILGSVLAICILVELCHELSKIHFL